MFKMKKPSGLSPNAICDKLKFWIQNLKDEISKTVPNRENVKTAEERIKLNLSERIIQDVFYGPVKNVKKAIKRNEIYTSLILKKNILSDLISVIKILSPAEGYSVYKLFNVICQNSSDEYRKYMAKHYKSVIDPIVHIIRSENNLNTDTNSKMSDGSFINIVDLLELLVINQDESSTYIIKQNILNDLFQIILQNNDFMKTSSVQRLISSMCTNSYFGIYYNPNNNLKLYSNMISLFNKVFIPNSDSSNDFTNKLQMSNILHEMFLVRSNHNIMMKYISNIINLKIIFNLFTYNYLKLKWSSFNILSIFFANPKKSYPVSRFIIFNKEILINNLKYFQDLVSSNEENASIVNGIIVKYLDIEFPKLSEPVQTVRISQINEMIKLEVFDDDMELMKSSIPGVKANKPTVNFISNFHTIGFNSKKLCKDFYKEMVLTYGK